MTAYIIAPSIIASDLTHLSEQITACEAAGADWIHVDVMDAHFVPNLTVGPIFVEACRRVTKLPLDVHLMMEEPERYLEAFAKAGASSLTVHVETCPDLDQTLQQIRSLGCRTGLTLNPDTPASALEPGLPLTDLVLVMSVHPGFSGQTFLPETVDKVSAVRRRLDALGSHAHLEVDGSINSKTLPMMKAAGANVFVAGTAVFKHAQGIEAGIKALRDAIGK